jgi:AcrR family transcriptional regulator
LTNSSFERKVNAHSANESPFNNVNGGSVMEKNKRKEQEYHLRREAILEQAGRVFGARGFHGTTMADIAGESGFAVGTLYRYFESKEKLYTEMVTGKLETMYAGVRESVAAQAAFPEKLRALVDAHFNFVEANLPFLRLFLRGEHLSLDKAGTTLQDWMVERSLLHISFIEALMRDGIAGGSLREVAPRVMAFALLGMINSHSFSRLLAETTKREIDGDVSVMLDIFLQGVRNANAH